MDETIRSILYDAMHGDNNEGDLMKAYSKLKRGQPSSDQSSPFAADVYVICAETAYQLKKFNVAEDCLKMFFQKAESGNECLGRAYICQAQLNQPESSKFPEQLEKCASFLLKAINFGKVNKNHNYLVYNASVLYSSFARPFLKPNYKHLLAKTLHQIVKALDDTDDRDYEWRTQLMISLIECYLDGGKKEDAAQVSIAAASFAKAYCPKMYKTILSLQVQHKLIEQSKLLKDAKQSTDVAIYLRILKLKSFIESGEKIEVDAELDRIFRTTINDGMEPQGTGRSTRMGQINTSGPITKSEKSSLLVDLIKLCVECGKVSLAEDYAESAKGGAKESSVALELDFLKSEIAAQKLKEKKSQYTKTSVEKRINAIRKLEDSLQSAIRLKTPTLIQNGCVTMWNLCLPLFQKNFRKSIRAPLSLVADALEEIDSLLLLMRCEIHIELAKCEEDMEQLESAMNHLKKALLLDDTGVHRSRIEGSLHKLQLRSMLYQLPDKPEDLASLIIEQARTTTEAGKLQMKRASLIKAGMALAPDSFGLVMDGEAGLSLYRSGPTNPDQLAEKVSRYRKSVSIISGHIKRLGNENERERAHIWADLAKIARKQSVWDVTRVAAKFCLLYDDGRWEAGSMVTSAKEDSKSTVHPTSGSASHQEASSGKRSVSDLERAAQDDTDLMLIIAEIHFIHAEALVQLLQAEGVKLLESPSPIEDLSMKPKSREESTKKVDDTREWNMYREWIQSLCDDSIEGFHRAAKLGVTLNAPWLVSNAGVYLWNYANHILATGGFAKLTGVFQPVYSDLKILGYLEDVPFFCDFAHSLARGFMQQHLPSSRQATPVQAEKEKKTRGGKRSASPTHAKGKAYVPVNDPDVIAELKQALEILEHILSLTNGIDVRCLVSISTRQPIIKTWVLCKMLVGQLLPKNLGHDDETPNSQGPMSKALCAIEAHVLQQQYSFDLTNCPGLFETIKMVENCKWTDRLVEIEAWTRLASLTSKASFCQMVIQCGERALELGRMSKPVNLEKLNDAMKHQYKVEQELLYYSSILMGQNLVAIMHGRTETRHKALQHFHDACKFATKARNYRLALSAAQYYWNTCQHFISTPIERNLLKEPIKGILKCIIDVWKYSELKEEDEQLSDENGKVEKPNKPLSVKESTINAKSSHAKVSKSPKGSAQSSVRVRIGGEKLIEHFESSKSQLDAHLALRAAMYGVLFQAYADAGQWENGLKAMDDAIKVMPRTHHRLLIFKHRVIVNARLGNPVQFDMGKFKEADELLLSSMWYRVAKNSNDSRDQLIAFQNSIDCLQKASSKWQKVDYLSEFAEWLFVNEFPFEDSLDNLHMATDLIIDGIKSENLLMPSSAKQDRRTVDDGKDIGMKKIINECIDIRSLESLARLHVMIAQILENNSREAEGHVLTAAYCVRKVWQNAVRNAEKAVRDGTKPGDRPFSRTDSKRRDLNKVEKQGSKTCLPVTLDQWVNFSLPEKLKEHFSCDTYGYFISKKSLVKAELTVYYLEKLVASLRMYGHHTLTLPVCSLLCYIANSILNDKFLITASKLQLVDVLQDLQMTSGISNILKSLGLKYITEEDKADSREEIIVWKEKQAQVKDAETKRGLEKKRETVNTADSKTVEFCRNKKLIRGITKREIWSKIAGFLIKQGQYNDARDLLQEARQSAEAFNDNLCLAQIEYNYALIAYHECDWGAAISYLERIQNLEESLSFWSKVVLLKVDAYQRSLDLSTTFQSHPTDDSGDKAIMLLNSSIDVIEDLCEKSPNRFSQGLSVKATFKSRLADYFLEKSHESDNSVQAEVSQLLRESLAIFTGLGRRRDALNVIKQQIYQHRMKASSSTGEEKKVNLIKCLKTAREAVNIARETIDKVALPTSETAGTYLPIEEEMIDSMMQTFSISLDVLKEMTNDAKRKAEVLSRQDTMTELLDAFVGAAPVYTERQEEWNSIAKVIGEETLSLLTFVFSSCDNFPKHQSKAALNLGKCLHQLAQQRFPDLKEYDASKVREFFAITTEVASESNPEDEAKQEDDGDHDNEDDEDFDDRLSPRVIRRKQRAEKIQQKYAEYSMLVTQAAEYLLLAVQMGLKNGYKDITLKSSYALVECIGNRDPSVSVQYLALYQSAKAAITVGETAQRLFLDPHLSRVGGLTQQRKTLNEYAPNLNELAGVRGLNLELIQTESEAWRRLHIARNHLDIVKEIPFPITFVIFQHSPDRTAIHTAVLEKPRGNVLTGKKKDTSSGSTNRSRICSSSVNDDLLADLINFAEQFKSDVANLLLRKRHYHRQRLKRKEMLVSHEKSLQSTSEEALAFGVDVSIGEKKLQSNFEDLISAMEGYFGKALSHIQESLLQEPVAETIVILADTDLLKLPLEALPVFRHRDIRSVSRDLSLQVFYHRITQGELSDQQNGKADKAKMGKKDKVDVKAKSEKAVVNSKKGKVAKELVIGKDGVLLDLTNLRYITDPSNDWPNGEKDGPDCVMTELITQFKSRSSKWVGLNSRERLPSITELQKFLQDSPSLIFYGFERFLAHVPPQFVAPLCLTDCHLIAILDNMKTLQSSMRQGKLDARKCPTDLVLERPLETAITLSLCGAPCILSNQWQCEVTDNKSRLCNVMEALCEHAWTVGQGLQISRNPSKGKGGDQAGMHDEVESFSDKASSAQGKHKADGKTSKTQNRASGAESMRSSKASSRSSATQSKKEAKLRSENTLKERNDAKPFQEQANTEGSKTDDCFDSLLPYERYNMVLYGLPNFSASLQTGN